jgi:flagellar motor switch protein FliM
MTGTVANTAETTESVPPLPTQKGEEEAVVSTTGSKGPGYSGVLPQATLRKLRSQQEEFARCLESRLSVSLRLDLSVSVAKIQTIRFQKFLELSGTPLHLTLFKQEPLRGIGLLEIPPQLGLDIVNRLLGGSGLLEKQARPLTDIEIAVLDQVSNAMLAEWVARWKGIQELKPSILGHEIDEHFLNVVSRETLVLEMTFDLTLGESRGQFRIGVPYLSMEPLIRRLAGEVSAKQGGPAVAAPLTTPRWNPQLDDVPVKLTAVCSGVDLKVQAVATMKVGDTVPVEAQRFREVEIYMGGLAKFVGVLGTSEGRWAIQLAKKLEA